MTFSKAIIAAVSTLLVTIAFAGGTPEYVKLPKNYQSSFKHYTTMNRAGSAAVAKMYANDTAVASYRKGQSAAPGSVIIMEVYKPKKDATGKPIVGSDGVNVIDQLAAIAVMERRGTWPAGLAESEQVGNWGFAIYNADGSVKENDLACVTCHTPMEPFDFLFSHQELVEFAKR